MIDCLTKVGFVLNGRNNAVGLRVWLTIKYFGTDRLRAAIREKRSVPRQIFLGKETR
jgi:hypothetical protein